MSGRRSKISYRTLDTHGEEEHLGTCIGQDGSQGFHDQIRELKLGIVKVKLGR